MYGRKKIQVMLFKETEANSNADLLWNTIQYYSYVKYANKKHTLNIPMWSTPKLLIDWKCTAYMHTLVDATIAWWLATSPSTYSLCSCCLPPSISKRSNSCRNSIVSSKKNTAVRNVREHVVDESTIKLLLTIYSQFCVDYVLHDNFDDCVLFVNPTRLFQHFTTIEQLY